MRQDGTALGPAPDRLAVAAAPELLGSGGAAAGAGGPRAGRLGRLGDGRALPIRRRAADQPRPVAAAGIRAAHGAAHGRGADRLAGLQPRLCRAGGKEPARRENPDPGARHSAIGADPRLSVDHGDRVYRAVPGPAARGRMRRDLRDLHLAGLEHDVQPVPVAAHGAGRSDRGGADVSPVGLAAILAAGSAACRPEPGLEHDDVGFGRLVLCRRLRGDHGFGPDHHAARHRVLYRDGDRRRDLGAIAYAVLAMLIVILLYDQLLFRPLLAWSRKFGGDPRATRTTLARGS